MRADDSPATWGDLKRVYKKLDARIDECFESVAKGDDEQSAFWDEHQDKLERLSRALRRLQKEVRELTEE